MRITRREIGLLLPALAAAQTTKREKLASKAFAFDRLPVSMNANKNKQRRVFDGETTRGLALEMHETELDPGKMPHAAHHHVHEELLVLLEGKLEVTINNKTSTAEANSVVFVASGEEHGWRNVGNSTARYYVIAVGRAS